MGSIDWNIIKKCLPSVLKLVNAVKSRKSGSKDFLNTWNIYDENGVNVAEGLREIGKIYRTKFILKYLINEELQQDIREGCNRAEFWNKFQDAVFWGNGGVISSNNTHKQQESALFLMLIMNAIGNGTNHRWSIPHPIVMNQKQTGTISGVVRHV